MVLVAVAECIDAPAAVDTAVAGGDTCFVRGQGDREYRFGRCSQRTPCRSIGFLRIGCIELLGPETCIHQCHRVGDLDGIGADDGDRFEVLRPPHRTETSLTCTVTRLMDERGLCHLVLTRLPDTEYRRFLGGILYPFVRRHTVPAPVVAILAHMADDHLLRLSGVLPPQRLGLVYLDRLVTDIDPDRVGCLARDHHRIPSGILHHRGEASAEIGTGEPADRLKPHSHADHFTASARRGCRCP